MKKKIATFVVLLTLAVCGTTYSVVNTYQVGYTVAEATKSTLAGGSTGVAVGSFTSADAELAGAEAGAELAGEAGAAVGGPVGAAAGAILGFL